MMTTKQMHDDIEFLARRAQRAGSFTTAKDRDHGISSNSLVSLAYGVGELSMPSDWYDYAACDRAYQKMPMHRRTQAVADALASQRAHVAAKYPEWKGHYSEAMPTDFVSR